MNKIALLTPGVLPVPAVNGGAVETIIDSYLLSNTENNIFDVFSIFDNKVSSLQNKYENVNFIYYKGNLFTKLLDLCISFFAHIFFKNKNMVTFKNIVSRYFYFKSIKKYLRKNDYDLILLENHCAELLPFRSKDIYKKYYKKVIFHSHNKPAHYKHFLRQFNVIKTFYSVSNSLTSLWIKEMSRYNLSVDFKTILNGVDTSLFKPLLIDKKAKFNLDDEKRTILFTGRMTKDKGIFEVLDSFAKLDQSKYQLLIVGDLFYGTKVRNDEQDIIKKKIAKLQSNCVFTGFVSHAEMPFVYNAADIIVIPSTAYDSAPLALIESICSCKPIISTKVGGIPEYSKGKGVILLDVNENLANKISETIVKLENNKYYSELCDLSLKEYKKMDIKGFFNSLNKAIYDNIQL